MDLNRCRPLTSSHFVFGVHPLGCSAAQDTLKGGRQTPRPRKMRTLQTSAPRGPVPFGQPGFSRCDVLTLVWPDGVGSPALLPLQSQVDQQKYDGSLRAPTGAPIT